MYESYRLVAKLLLWVIQTLPSQVIYSAGRIDKLLSHKCLKTSSTNQQYINPVVVKRKQLIMLIIITYIHEQDAARNR